MFDALCISVPIVFMGISVYIFLFNCIHNCRQTFWILLKKSWLRLKAAFSHFQAGRRTFITSALVLIISLFSIASRISLDLPLCHCFFFDRQVKLFKNVVGYTTHERRYRYRRVLCSVPVLTCITRDKINVIQGRATSVYKRRKTRCIINK